MNWNETVHVSDAGPAAGHLSGPGLGHRADLVSRARFEAQLRRPEGGYH